MSLERKRFTMKYVLKTLFTSFEEGKFSEFPWRRSKLRNSM